MHDDAGLLILGYALIGGGLLLALILFLAT